MLSQIFATNKMRDVKMFFDNEVGDVKDSIRLKSVKPKTRRSESRKLSKSKKISKNENLSKFTIRKFRQNFLTCDAKMAFNHLRLAFIKALILDILIQNPTFKIKTDASNYAIGRILS